MMQRLNRAVIRLWHDESGVILAFSVIVFLTLFMMVCAVYAVGETVRQRIELQNAADAAAYSAAIVQADTLSRVAAINRAMSWTYVQLCRMEMDYIVDKWLYLVDNAWTADNSRMRTYNFSGTCNRGSSYYNTGDITLNNSQTVSIGTIRNARSNARAARKDFGSLAAPIRTARSLIETMGGVQVGLVNQLRARIESTAVRVLRANISQNWNDSIAGGANIAYCLKHDQQPLDDYFQVLTDEADFMRHSNYIPDQGNSPTAVLGTGSGNNEWYPNLGRNDGIQRGYVQRGNALVARWSWWSTRWQWVRTQYYSYCRRVGRISGQTTVRGQDGYEADTFNTVVAQPRILRPVFFGRNGQATGTIAVGLTRRLNNPLQFLVAGGGLGVFAPFTVSQGNRYMWTVATARAAYNPPQAGATIPREDCLGEYQEMWTAPADANALWNLKTSDWDAVLLPLARAWNPGSAGQILTSVSAGPWVPLYAGGGGGIGDQSAPQLMGPGNALNYGNAGHLVVH